MHTASFLQDFAIVLLVAGLVAVLFHSLRQPVVLGYVMAGVIIGPHTPPWPLIHDETIIRTFADMGVVFLMFHLGLEFSLGKLRRVGMGALVTAVIEILLMLCLGYAIGRGFGWSPMNSVFLGAMLSISSTIIIVKALEELGVMQHRFAQLSLGVLVVEDLLAVAIIALLSSFSRTGTFEALEGVMAMAKLAVFLVVTLAVGLISVPRLVDAVARRQRPDMLLMVVLGLCFGFCLVSVKLDYSVALAAFLTGALIAESRSVHRVERMITPLRELFSAIFFVSVGMLIDPALILTYAVPILVVTAVVVVGKVLSCTLGVLLSGEGGRTSLKVGMGLAQIGEFSFIIAALGLERGVIDSFLYPVIVTVAAITTFLTPYLLRWSDPLANRLAHWTPASLKSALNLYSQWAGRLQTPGKANPVRMMLRRSVWIVVINLTLIVGLFSSAAWTAVNMGSRLEALVHLTSVQLNALLWSTAVLLSVPLFIASYRKLQAISMLLAEMSMGDRGIGELPATLRAIVAQLIPLSALGVFSLLVIAASASILPPGRILYALLVPLLMAAWWLRRSFMRIYGRLQVALEQRIGSIAADDAPAAEDGSELHVQQAQNPQHQKVGEQRRDDGA